MNRKIILYVLCNALLGLSTLYGMEDELPIPTKTMRISAFLSLVDLYKEIIAPEIVLPDVSETVLNRLTRKEKKFLKVRTAILCNYCRMCRICKNEWQEFVEEYIIVQAYQSVLDLLMGTKPLVGIAGAQKEDVMPRLHRKIESLLHATNESQPFTKAHRRSPSLVIAPEEVDKRLLTLQEQSPIGTMAVVQAVLRKKGIDIQKNDSSTVSPIDWYDPQATIKASGFCITPRELSPNEE